MLRKFIKRKQVEKKRRQQRELIDQTMERRMRLIAIMEDDGNTGSRTIAERCQVFYDALQKEPARFDEEWFWHRYCQVPPAHYYAYFRLLGSAQRNLMLSKDEIGRFPRHQCDFRYSIEACSDIEDIVYYYSVFRPGIRNNLLRMLEKFLAKEKGNDTHMEIETKAEE